jgi:hypothetical protein
VRYWIEIVKFFLNMMETISPSGVMFAVMSSLIVSFMNPAGGRYRLGGVGVVTLWIIESGFSGRMI